MPSVAAATLVRATAARPTTAPVAAERPVDVAPQAIWCRCSNHPGGAIHTVQAGSTIGRYAVAAGSAVSAGRVGIAIHGVEVIATGSHIAHGGIELHHRPNRPLTNRERLVFARQPRSIRGNKLVRPTGWQVGNHAGATHDAAIAGQHFIPSAAGVNRSRTTGPRHTITAAGAANAVGATHAACTAYATGAIPANQQGIVVNGSAVFSQKGLQALNLAL